MSRRTPNSTAVRARGQDSRGVEPPAYLPCLRRRESGWDRLPGDGVPGGGDARPAADEGRTAARPGARGGHPDRDALDKAHRKGIVHRDLKPGTSSWCGARSRQLARCRHEAPRLRAGEAAHPWVRPVGWRSARPRRSVRPSVRAGASPSAELKRPLTGAGASSARSSTWRQNSSKARRRTRGRTSLRLARSLRNGDGEASVRGEESGKPHRRDHEQRTDASFDAAACHPSSPGPARCDVSGERSGRPLADGARSARAS